MTILPPTDAATLPDEALDAAPAIDSQEAKRRMACALNDLRSSFNSPLTGYRFAVLQQPFRDFDAGTPVAQCDTATGQYLAVFDEFMLEGGRLQPVVQPMGNYQPRHALRRAAAKSLLSEIGKMLLKKAADNFVDLGSDQELVEELSKVKTELIDFMKSVQLENFENEIIQIRSWLNDTYQPRLQRLLAGENVPAQEVYGGLLKRQEQMQNLANVLYTRIADSELEKSTYHVRQQVLLHALAYGLRTVLLAEQITWCKPLAKQGTACDEQGLRDELRTFVERHATRSEHYLAKLWTARRGYISELYDGLMTRSNSEVAASAGSASILVHHEWAWTDRFESAKADDPFEGEQQLDRYVYLWNGKEEDRKERSDKARECVAAHRNQHISNVTSLFNKYVRHPLEETAANARTRSKAV